jgi:hypothetical protein
MKARLLAGMVRASILGSSLALASPAVAAEPEAAAAADKVFQEAVALMDAGNYAEACPRLEQVQQLDPGMATQFRLAQCYEGLGKLGSAWRNYTEVARAARAAGMADREQAATQKADELKPKLSMLKIVVPAAVAAVAGVRVLRDGAEVPSKLWGVEVPTDSGDVQIEITAPGKQPWTKVVRVEGAGQLFAVEPPPWPATPSPQQPGTEDSGLGPQAIAGITVGLVGLAAMGAGIGVGLAAKSKWSDSADYCQDSYCHPEGLDIRDSARGLGTAGTVIFVVGTAALVGGGVLWLTASSGDEGSEAAAPAAVEPGLPRVQLGLTPGGMAARARW